MGGLIGMFTLHTWPERRCDSPSPRDAGGEDFLNTFPSLRTNSTLLGATVAIYEIGALFGKPS